MPGAWWFGADPGRMLEDAFRAGVVNKLVAADQTLLHPESAPGAEAIGEVGRGWRLVRFRGSGVGHVRHSPRPLRTLSIDRVIPDRVGAKKSFSILPQVKRFVV